MGVHVKSMSYHLLIVWAITTRFFLRTVFTHVFNRQSCADCGPPSSKAKENFPEYLISNIFLLGNRETPVPRAPYCRYRVCKQRHRSITMANHIASSLTHWFRWWRTKTADTRTGLSSDDDDGDDGRAEIRCELKRRKIKLLFYYIKSLN